MSDTLTVRLSGDAADGDAQAIIDINGQQVGNIVDVSAVNANDDANAFTFTGNYGAHPQVTVSFINNTTVNDGNGQRDLYVDGFIYDGVPLFGNKQEATYDQSMNFTLTSTPASAERASTFVNSIGVDTHLGDNNLSYGNTAVVASALSYLGIYHVRDGLPNAADFPEYKALGAAGIKFDLGMPFISSDALLPGQLAVINALAPYVSSVEGPNEVDLFSSFSWNGQSGYGAAVAYQQALWSAVKADPALSSATVYVLTTGGSPDSYQALGNLSPYASDGNAHVYFYHGGPPYLTLQYATSVVSASTPSLPTVVTETGYSTSTIPYQGVDQGVQARYDLDLLVDAAKQGIPAAYFYELLDDVADPADTNYENHFGLFNADGTPKLAATAIHNLSAILQDNGPTAASFTPGVLSYTVTGMPASGDTLLLQQSNGIYDLVIWAEPKIWNADTSTDIAVPSHSVTINLAQAAASVSVLDPLLGTSPIAQFSNIASLPVTVSDHPVILQISPTTLNPNPPITTSSSTGSMVSDAPTVTLGSGPDTLALNVSEDYFQGDAQFTISVDGNQVGGTQTATALHSTGASQAFDIAGNLATGQHVVSVNFLNDLWNSSGDRNLFVTSATVDGQVIAGAVLTEDSSGPQQFSFIGPAGAVTDLTLHLSEDAWNGDAAYSVTVDGNPLGSGGTVTALHGLGQSQSIDLSSVLSTGTHDVGISFLNDAYGGSPATDRNLYIDGIAVNGISNPGASATLLSSGTTHFQVIVPALS